ncbi:hypothetical protein DE146DRAFT_674363 [Phaeosphaeria sp. MPI-PUGE-AT-0046c]|nr:hypothetical protein DE146DRAFT_674363 [Phaeosphaeria sp. MPI-PUGE-AT-0046c]
MSSDYTTHRRTSSRQTSLSSPLDQAPKFSPPTLTSRNPSPVRKALHDRSNSQTNQYSGPTIRIVEDPGSDIYSKYPVPTEPSHILPPPRHAPGYGFETGSRVSAGSQVASTIAKFEASKTRVLQPPPPLQLARKKKYRHSVSTSNSDADTLVASSYTPSSLRFSQGSTPPTSPPPEFTEFEKGLEVLEEESTQPRPKSTIRAVPPSSSGGESDASRARALTSKASAASFASTITAASPPPNGNAGDPTSHIQTFPRGHKHTTSSSSAKGLPIDSSGIDQQHPALRPKASEVSFAFSDISYTSIEPTHHTIPSSQPSPTLHEARTATITSGVPVTYPLVRAPSATSLRAASEDIPSFASRMQDRSLVHQWSSQLSTIPSVSDRDSRSLARGSRSYTRSQSQESYIGNNNNGQSGYPRRRRSTIASAQSSTDNVSYEGHTEFSAVPLPLFSPVSYSAMEEKDHLEEHLDTISPLPTSVPLRMKRSDYLRRHDSASDSGSNTESRPGSVQSDMSAFVHNAIPAWARYEANLLPYLHTANGCTECTTAAANAFQLALPDQTYIDHVTDRGIAPHKQILCLLPMRCYLRMEGSTFWVRICTPLTEEACVIVYGRRHLLTPISTAHFLVVKTDRSCSSALASSSLSTDLEQQFARNIGAVDDKAFQKATWWRNLNRIMSGIGTLLVSSSQHTLKMIIN